MSRIYKIRISDNKKSVLSVHPETAFLLGIGKTKKVTLRFGSLCQYADVVLNSDMPESEIVLSPKLAASLHIPDFPDYELKNGKNEIEFGPFIGMLLSREDKRLTQSALERMKVYMSDYNNLHGAIVIFALDKTDAVGRLVEGYCYNPSTGDFEKGIYPFPTAIYRAVGLDDRWKNCFFSVIGDRFFNNHYFSKWQMYQWYSQNPGVADNVPFTNILKTADDVFDMLLKYGKVYIKPVSGLGGHGITRVTSTERGYEFSFRENGENRTELKINKDDAIEYINTKFSHGRYLIQQPIELIKINDSVVDFRCIMQKNQLGNWSCRAVIGRYGKRGSIVSNISSGGTAFNLDNTAGTAIPIKGDRAFVLKNEISAFALKVCKALDGYGFNCGTVGLDVGVDINGKLWLIEINNRDPDPTIALDANDRPLYIKIKTGILTYAKYLAGFN